MQVQTNALVVAKYPKMISPSALGQYEGQPNTFFLERMIQDPQPKTPQSESAAVGSGFDAWIKVELCERYGWDLRERILRDDWFGQVNDSMSLKEMLFAKACEEQHRGLGYGIGYQLLQAYKMTPLYKMKWSEIELKRKFEWAGVPCLGILDGVLEGDVKQGDVKQGDVIQDWKVTGWGSPQSPKKGYCESWINGVPKGSHKGGAIDDMSVIDSSWATQGAFYGKMLGLKPPYGMEIHQLLFKTNDIQIVRYKGVITVEWVNSVERRVVKMWNELCSGEFFKRIGPDRLLCEINSHAESWF